MGKRVRPEEMTAEQVREALAAAGKKRKYRNEPVHVDGVRFDSRKEARRYGQLLLLLRDGQITGLRLQPEFPLVVEGVRVGKYVGDFAYTDASTGAEVVEDAKGVRTPVYRLKRRLVKAIYGFDVMEV